MNFDKLKTVGVEPLLIESERDGLPEIAGPDLDEICGIEGGVTREELDAFLQNPDLEGILHLLQHNLDTSGQTENGYSEGSASLGESYTASPDTTVTDQVDIPINGSPDQSTIAVGSRLTFPQSVIPEAYIDSTFAPHSQQSPITTVIVEPVDTHHEVSVQQGYHIHASSVINSLPQSSPSHTHQQQLCPDKHLFAAPTSTLGIQQTHQIRNDSSKTSTSLNQNYQGFIPQGNLPNQMQQVYSVNQQYAGKSIDRLRQLPATTQYSPAQRPSSTTLFSSQSSPAFRAYPPDAMSPNQIQTVQQNVSPPTNYGVDQSGIGQSPLGAIAQPLSSGVEIVRSNDPDSLESTIDKKTDKNATKRKRGVKGKTSKTKSAAKKEEASSCKAEDTKMWPETAMEVTIGYRDLEVVSKMIVDCPTGCLITPGDSKEDFGERVGDSDGINGESGGPQNIFLKPLDEVPKCKNIKSENTKKAIRKILVSSEGGLHLELNDNGMFATRKCMAHIYWSNSTKGPNAVTKKLERNVPTKVFDCKSFKYELLQNIQTHCRGSRDAQQAQPPEQPYVWFVFAQEFKRGTNGLKSTGVWCLVSPKNLMQSVVWYFHVPTNDSQILSLTEDMAMLSAPSAADQITFTQNLSA